MKFHSADKDVIALKTEFWESVFELSILYPSMTFLSCVEIWRKPGEIEINPEYLNYASYLLEANKGLGSCWLLDLTVIRIIT